MALAASSAAVRPSTGWRHSGAICANGPRQNAQLRPLVEQHGGEWENLPPDTFAESGTAVNTALFTLTA